MRQRLNVQKCRFYITTSIWNPVPRHLSATGISKHYKNNILIPSTLPWHQRRCICSFFTKSNVLSLSSPFSNIWTCDSSKDHGNIMNHIYLFSTVATNVDIVAHRVTTKSKQPKVLKSTTVGTTSKIKVATTSPKKKKTKAITTATTTTTNIPPPQEQQKSQLNSTFTEPINESESIPILQHEILRPVENLQEKDHSHMEVLPLQLLPLEIESTLDEPKLSIPTRDEPKMTTAVTAMTNKSKEIIQRQRARRNASQFIPMWLRREAEWKEMVFQHLNLPINSSKVAKKIIPKTNNTYERRNFGAALQGNFYEDTIPSFSDVLREGPPPVLNNALDILVENGLGDPGVAERYRTTFRIRLQSTEWVTAFNERKEQIKYRRGLVQQLTTELVELRERLQVIDNNNNNPDATTTTSTDRKSVV